jgi:uncharacterized repeat protein (TIGR04138 family)
VTDYSESVCQFAVKSGVQPEAIDFIWRSFEFVPNYRGEEPGGYRTKPQHSTAQDFCRAFVGLAKDTYGNEYVTTLERWGLNTSEKLGDAVYRLIDCGAMRRTEDDHPRDFDGQFDLTKSSA